MTEKTEAISIVLTFILTRNTETLSIDSEELHMLIFLGKLALGQSLNNALVKKFPVVFICQQAFFS
jgi:hypothetical protein